MDAVGVLVVDDQEAFLSTMHAVVDATSGFVVVGEARSAEQSIEVAAALQPDLVLMDVHLGVLDGIEATRLLCRGCPWSGGAAAVDVRGRSGRRPRLRRCGVGAQGELWA